MATAVAWLAAGTCWLACGDTPTTADPDAAPAPTGTATTTTTTTGTSTPPPKDAQPDAPVPADATVPDAADASGLDAADASSLDAADASGLDAADASGLDAADAASPGCGAAGGRLCSLGETCAADRDCAGPNVCEANVCAAGRTVLTVADLANLTHFDFEGSTLLYTVSTAATKVNTCTLPGCADGAEVPNVTMETASNRYFAPALVGGYIQYPVAMQSGSSWTVMAQRSLDGATAGASGTLGCARVGFAPSDPIVYGAHGGVGFVGLYRCITNAQASYRAFDYRTASTGAGTNPDRVGRGAASRHTNGDAVVTFTPGSQTYTPMGEMPQAPVMTGTHLGGTYTGGNRDPSTWPAELVTSPKSVGGVDIAHPTVAFRTAAGGLRIFRRASPYGTLVLPHVVTTLNLDERYLYVGQPAGLGRCELSEIATRSTCTLSAMTADAVQAPLYITPTHVWYRSGTRIRRATK